MLNKLKSHLYVLQLLEYDADKFFGWVLKNPGFYPQPQKGKMGLSAKTRIIYRLSILLQFFIPMILSGLIITKQRNVALYTAAAAIFIGTIYILIIVPFIPLTISLFVIKPAEWVFSLYLMNKARSKLRLSTKLKVVAITGSFGKTSVKQILTQIISGRYEVVATPESHNKMISIARCIISKITPKTEIFIVEMGAYKTGEINRICKLVKPRVGVITGVTSQHLAGFKTFENIKRAKFELIENLPSDGFAIFNIDSPGAMELYERCQIKKDGYSIKGMKIEVKAKETSFELFGNVISLPLLGYNNVLNVLAAVKIAGYLGLADEEILLGLKSITPVPHRLESVKSLTNPDSLIIDDAYSGNIEGYKAAFELVKNLKYYPKILVTPGLVEMGEEQYKENFRMAKAASEIFDFVVITNLENREPLVSGLEERDWLKSDSKNYEEKEIWVRKHQGLQKDKVFFPVGSLKEATDEVIPIIAQRNFLILFENDLPDIYR